MGIILLAIVGLYLLVSLGVVIGAMAYARKAGKSAKRWGWGAGLVMYLIPLWDWLPTVAVHQYYCATEAGFWVYKTPEQWMKENPGVIETLVANKVSVTRVGDDENHIDTQALNQRFSWTTEKHRLVLLLPVYSWKSEVVDIKRGETAVRHLDYSIGKGRDHPKFWMNISNCTDGISNRDRMFRFVEALINLTDLTKRNAK